MRRIVVDYVSPRKVELARQLIGDGVIKRVRFINTGRHTLKGDFTRLRFCPIDRLIEQHDVRLKLFKYVALIESLRLCVSIYLISKQVGFSSRSSRQHKRTRGRYVNVSKRNVINSIISVLHMQSVSGVWIAMHD